MKVAAIPEHELLTRQALLESVRKPDPNLVLTDEQLDVVAKAVGDAAELAGDDTEPLDKNKKNVRRWR